MSRRQFYRCMAWLFTNVPPAFFSFGIPGSRVVVVYFCCIDTDVLPCIALVWGLKSARPGGRHASQVSRITRNDQRLGRCQPRGPRANSCTPFGLTCISNRK